MHEKGGEGSQIWSQETRQSLQCCQQSYSAVQFPDNLFLHGVGENILKKMCEESYPL